MRLQIFGVQEKSCGGTGGIRFKRLRFTTEPLQESKFGPHFSTNNRSLKSSKCSSHCKSSSSSAAVFHNSQKLDPRSNQAYIWRMVLFDQTPFLGPTCGSKAVPPVDPLTVQTKSYFSTKNRSWVSPGRCIWGSNLDPQFRGFDAGGHALW